MQHGYQDVVGPRHGHAPHRMVGPFLAGVLGAVTVLLLVRNRTKLKPFLATALRPDLLCLPQAIRLSRLATARVGGNFRFIVGVNSAIAAAALLGRTLPAMSALAHNLATVTVSVRSLRPYLPASMGRERTLS